MNNSLLFLIIFIGVIIFIAAASNSQCIKEALSNDCSKLKNRKNCKKNSNCKWIQVNKNQHRCRPK
jgi:hypothetical protein